MKNKLTLLYDGACHLCSREIEHYREKDHRGALRFVDISEPHFDPGEFDVGDKPIQRYFHVVTEDGQAIEGVEAFREIWKRLPELHWMARLSEPQVIRVPMKAAYRIFAEIRPYLPKKKTAACETHCPVE